MLERVARYLAKLSSSSSRRSESPARPAHVPGLALEVLEGRLALAHLVTVAPAAVVPLGHFSPVGETEKVALLDKMIAAAPKSSAEHSALTVETKPVHLAPTSPPVEVKPVHSEPTRPPVALKPVEPAPISHPTHATPTPTPSVPGPITIQPWPLPVVPPQPAPKPVQPPILSPGSPGNSSFDPTRYVPELCTTATFSGTMGADGHYSSFQVIGHNPTTGTTVIVDYFTGTPYGVPVYHWDIVVNSTTYGNWGNNATVYVPYYVTALPLPVTYREGTFGPGV
jgi:hypothetical protein